MIGSNLVKKLVDLGFEVYVVDNLWKLKKIICYQKIKMVIPNKILPIDLRDYENCRNKIDILFI